MRLSTIVIHAEPDVFRNQYIMYLYQPVETKEWGKIIWDFFLSKSSRPNPQGGKGSGTYQVICWALF